MTDLLPHLRAAAARKADELQAAFAQVENRKEREAIRERLRVAAAIEEALNEVEAE